MLLNSGKHPDYSGCSDDHSSSILRDHTPTATNLPDNLLVCHDWDNSIRWQAGERLQHLFEQRCDQLSEAGYPLHLAVDSLNGQWSYQDLDERANQVARHLKNQTLGAGDIIGLLFDKSVHSYVSMLAVLKINAAYVPLDPAFPEDRIAYIASDAGLKSILTLSQYASLTQESGLPAICFDSDASKIDVLTKERLNTDEAGEPVNELCYIIYTSGSTGRPKGVPIEQASICNFVRVAAEVYGYQSSDRVYQGLTIAFDFAVEEIWVPLVVGATLLPNQTGSSLLGCDLADFLQHNNATAMCCVPTLLQTIEEDLPDLRLLIVSGEACPQDLIERWYTPERTILNAYGPTETTVTATLARSKPGELVTIGKPLPTYSVVILEPDTENVLPFGEEGEIAVAGVGVAEGYLNREEQTKKSFIKDFLNIENNSSDLIYRTGDLGLVNDNGDIEYRGRIDLQVKIRGYRIELTEIESVILQNPKIAQAVVDTFEPMPGVKELVAYYTLKEDIESLPQEILINELRELLPNYMVPSYYEQLDIMPMMASDKADRKALPKPAGQRMNAGSHEIIEPRTPMEMEIAKTLSDLLQLDAISVTDNFFENLGASSLLMAQFGAQLRKRLPDADVSMRDFYAHPSVEKLAVHLNSQPSEQRSEIDIDEFRIPSNKEYITCGLLQLSSYFAFFFIGIWFLLKVFPWIISSSDTLELYLRISGFLAGTFFAWVGISIAIKWTVIGKWTAEKIPIWSYQYYRFWLYKQLILANPMALFRGYPIYNVYLRLMGAKIGRNVVIECQKAPLCADLLEIGDNTILCNDSQLVSYKARSNYIYTGPISIGSNVIVGEGSVVDIHTVMEDNTQLGHASCLQEGQTIPEGKHYHGNPAEETTTDFSSGDTAHVSTLRRVVYSAGQLLNGFLGTVPLLLCLAVYLIVSFALPKYEPLTLPWAMQILSIAAVAFTGFFFLLLFFNTVVTRLLNRFLEVDRSYVLYGVHFLTFKMIQGFSNSTALNLLFGDSSFIVHYVKLVGYKLSRVVQTGSNFGLEHKHDNPFLCHYGSGTLISDGFSMLNVHQSSTAFRLAKATVGNSNFVGNNVYYPADSKTGNNCLIATKAMVPIDGKIRENVGLLGSPSFEIPRAMNQDNALNPMLNESIRREGLGRKNFHNLATIAEFIICGFVFLYVTLLMVYAAAQSYGDFGIITWIIAANLFLIFSIAYFVVMERGAYAFGRMKPVIVSIYDDEYWKVERVWKYSENFLRWLWLGTPFRSLINRLLGIKQGKKVFDDGLYVSEKTLTEIGDYCNFNVNSVLQAHSLEDGIYKSDHIKIGNRCTLETNAFVHYGVTAGDDVVIHADSFVIKGEQLDHRSMWGGNPAKELCVRSTCLSSRDTKIVEIKGSANPSELSGKSSVAVAACALN